MAALTLGGSPDRVPQISNHPGEGLSQMCGEAGTRYAPSPDPRQTARSKGAGEWRGGRESIGVSPRNLARDALRLARKRRPPASFVATFGAPGAAGMGESWGPRPPCARALARSLTCGSPSPAPGWARVSAPSSGFGARRAALGLEAGSGRAPPGLGSAWGSGGPPGLTPPRARRPGWHVALRPLAGCWVRPAGTLEPPSTARPDPRGHGRARHTRASRNTRALTYAHTRTHTNTQTHTPT